MTTEAQNKFEEKMKEIQEFLGQIEDSTLKKNGKINRKTLVLDLRGSSGPTIPRTPGKPQ